MRLFVTFATGITAAALLTPLALTGSAGAAGAAAPVAVPGAGPTAASGAGSAVPAAVPAADASGHTQSLALAPLTSSRAGGTMVLSRSRTEPFAMVGVVWKDPDAELHGRVRVRARSVETGRWSGWQELQTHNRDAPSPGPAEGDPAARHGGTAPLWVGDSDGVEVRVVPETQPRGDARQDGAEALPGGLTAELIDPGDGEVQPVALDGEQAGETAGAGAGEGGRDAEPAARGPGDGTEIAAQSKAASEAEAVRLNPALPEAARPFVGPRPRIITRKGWRANERLRERRFKYTKTVNIAFVHHTASGNSYSCRQAPRLIRGIYRYHVKSQGWADIGYNFLIDKCGRIYEGRAGGVTRAVMGAHTYGFNHNSMGIAVLGSHDSTAPTRASVRGVARLTAWKLGLYGRNPAGTQLKVSGGGLYKKGKRVRLRVISGHRDGFATDCPGGRLYSRLGTIRLSSARYQGRR